ncbi:MAG: hypothetical protein ACXU9U_05565, partial [Parachlamydiaceae bacterium]
RAISPLLAIKIFRTLFPLSKPLLFPILYVSTTFSEFPANFENGQESLNEEILNNLLYNNLNSF